MNRETAPWTRDVRRDDVAVAAAVAVAVFALGAGMLTISKLDHRSDAPPIDPGTAIAIAVTPVTDTAGPASSGTLPPRWRRNETPERTTDAPVAQPTIGKSATRTRKEARSPAPPSGQSPVAVDPSAEPLLPATDPESGSATESPPYTSPANDDGDTSSEAVNENAARAIESYRQRLIRWLAGRFRVTGSGLGRADLLRYRVRATVQIDASGTVTGYSIKPSGSVAFDAAGRAALNSIVGEQVPPPPDDYPGALQAVVHTTFQCKESTCD